LAPDSPPLTKGFKAMRKVIVVLGLVVVALIVWGPRPYRAGDLDLERAVDLA